MNCKGCIAYSLYNDSWALLFPTAEPRQFIHITVLVGPPTVEKFNPQLIFHNSDTA